MTVYNRQVSTHQVTYLLLLYERKKQYVEIEAMMASVSTSQKLTHTHSHTHTPMYVIATVGSSIITVYYSTQKVNEKNWKTTLGIMANF